MKVIFGYCMGLSLLLSPLDTRADSSRFKDTLSTGLVHPAFLYAARDNASAIVNDRIVAVGDMYTPAQSYNSSNWSNTATLAIGDRHIGAGAGYTFGKSGANFNQLFAGVAIRLKEVSVGYGFTAPIGQTDYPGFNPDSALSFGIASEDKVSGVFAIEHINGHPQPHIGIAYAKENQYQLEANLLLPGFSGLLQAGAQYAIGAGMAVFVGPVGVAFRTTYNYTYQVGGGGLDSHLGAVLWFAQNWNLLFMSNISHNFSFGISGFF